MNGLNRRKTSLPDLYYEGYLEKRSFRDKAALKRWTALSGNTLFFFNSSKDANFLEKLELVNFRSVTDDPTRDSNLDKARFNVHLKDMSLKFTAPSLEARELWKGYIHAVVELSLPSGIILLPGQTRDLQQAVERERERRRLPPPLPTPPLPAAALPDEGGARSHAAYNGPLPECYVQATRVEAELLLEREAGRGNLLLRPGGHGNTFTITTREVHMSPIFKHYRVTQNPGEGFIIDLKEPIDCATLDEVITVMLEVTGGTLTPLISEDNYEDNITFIKFNKESGEKSVCFPAPRKTPPTPPSKPAGVQREYLQVEPPSRIPILPKRSENAEKNSLPFTRPCNPPPSIPNGYPTKQAAASSAVTPKQCGRIALMPSAQKKRESEGSHADERVPTGKPVPTPRSFPPRQSSAARSKSDVSCLSLELKEAFLKKRIFKE
ncbi:signal-transducing adaptor protein 1-like isoform X3 [Gadus chalcogrammus]|uniref:signal-transducing adaptor protein 1-like isoform X3 n=1 Tax=Gadus chalcogrammus TaxID=1042646 RepID=UPI0024C4C04C|nr:signal-transducing adaptor protein 1-like isoform X3 [Gadus chalcogrammus]